MTQVKTKTTQKKDLENVSERDKFFSPRYSVNILIPFLKNAGFHKIWECASGENAISDVLVETGFSVHSTDLNYNSDYHIRKWNFITDKFTKNDFDLSNWCDCIITNPPFSLKSAFYKRCMEINKPFALLIPADYSGWLIDAFQHGLQRITPSRRIDYITPNTVSRVNEKLGIHYSTIYDIPNKVLRKFTSSDFHSYWAVYGFNLPKDEVFVELTNEMKDDIK